MGGFTHLDEGGKVKMVNVGGKAESERKAQAFCRVFLNNDVFEKIKNNNIAKGDVLCIAKIAGIQAAKKTHELIPLCHNIFLSGVDITFSLDGDKNAVEIISEVSTTSRTGVEMEALTAASAAALTIYDMCKSLDKSIVISDLKLLRKSGGKSGDYIRAED